MTTLHTEEGGAVVDAARMGVCGHLEDEGHQEGPGLLCSAAFWLGGSVSALCMVCLIAALTQ